MKTNYLLVCSFALSAMLYSCGGNETTEEGAAESTEMEAEAETAESKDCKLTSYSFQLGDKERTLSFHYDGDNLKSLEMSEKDSEDKQALSYEYNEAGNLASFSMDNNKAEYIYDENGRLSEIKGEGNLNTRTFEYDENGRMIKQVTMFGGKPYTTHVYEYENDIPTKVDLLMKGELFESYKIAFDDKNNPLMHKGIFANSTEMMLGYAVANYQHNVVSITSTNKAGEEDMRSVTFEYDDFGNPLKEIRKRGDKEIVTSYVYECK